MGSLTWELHIRARQHFLGPGSLCQYSGKPKVTVIDESPCAPSKWNHWHKDKTAHTRLGHFSPWLSPIGFRIEAGHDGLPEAHIVPSSCSWPSLTLILSTF